MMRRSIALCLVTAVIAITNTVEVALAQPCDPVEVTKLLASDGVEDDSFGWSVAISDNIALVGALSDEINGTNSGAAYIFRFNGSEWIEEAKLMPSDGEAEDQFGRRVALGKNMALIRANSNDNGTDAGAVYVFRYDGSNWLEEAKLMPSDGREFEFFGMSIAIAGNTALIASVLDDVNGYRAGSAYVFRYDGVQWVEEARLFASDPATGDLFGISLALVDDMAMVGAIGDDDNGPESGSVYVFGYDGSNWSERAKLLSSDGVMGDFFGSAMEVSDDVLLIGAVGADDSGESAGAAYIFRHNGVEWLEEVKLLAEDGETNDRFGDAVSISGDTVIIGANGDDDLGNLAGAAYVFHHTKSGWTQAAKLVASDGEDGEIFSFSVAVSGDTAIVSAPRDQDNGPSSGSAFIFNLNCGTSNCLDLSIENLVAGEEASFTISGGTTGSKGATVYGLKVGKSSVKGFAGYCATFGIQGINPNRVIGGLNRTFDTNGEITFNLKIPRQAAGLRILFQSAERGTCPDECVSNLVEAVVK